MDAKNLAAGDNTSTDAEDAASERVARKRRELRVMVSMRLPRRTLERLELLCVRSNARRPLTRTKMIERLVDEAFER